MSQLQLASLLLFPFPLVSGYNSLELAALESRTEYSLSPLPLLLAPDSRPRSPTRQQRIDSLSAHLSQLDAERRRTGSLAGGRKGWLGPLLCTRVHGVYRHSPWAVAAGSTATAEDEGKRERELRNRRLQRGLPRDIEEAQQWQQEDQRWLLQLEQEHGASHKRQRIEREEEEEVHSAPVQVQLPNQTVLSNPNQQQSLLANFGASTKPSLTNGNGALSNGKKRPSPPSPSSPALSSPKNDSYHPFKHPHLSPPPAPMPALNGFGLAFNLAGHIEGSSSGSSLKEPQINSQERLRGAEEVQFVTEHGAGGAGEGEAGGRSLGEDEQVLGEGGCTQVSFSFPFTSLFSSLPLPPASLILRSLPQGSTLTCSLFHLEIEPSDDFPLLLLSTSIFTTPSCLISLPSSFSIELELAYETNIPRSTTTIPLKRYSNFHSSCSCSCPCSFRFDLTFFSNLNEDG